MTAAGPPPRSSSVRCTSRGEEGATPGATTGAGSETLAGRDERELAGDGTRAHRSSARMRTLASPAPAGVWSAAMRPPWRRGKPEPPPIYVGSHDDRMTRIRPVHVDPDDDRPTREDTVHARELKQARGSFFGARRG
jgi:hypothetical protein